MKKSIVLLPGDGIGPEVTAAVTHVLKECAREFHHDFQFADHPVGGSAIDLTGTPLPNATVDACRKADAIFLGRSRRSEVGYASRRQAPGKWSARSSSGHGTFRQCSAGETPRAPAGHVAT